MEAALLGGFMISACAFGALLEHPDSPVRNLISSPLLRRVLMGIAMGLTAVSLIHSPWGKQSGAHLNPAVTLTFLRLGKVRPADAIFYILFQFAGGLAGVLLAAWLLSGWIAHPSVRYVTTVPGPSGLGAAFTAEALISFGLISVVLTVSNHSRIARFTGTCAGALVACYITFEAPLSGMSMNPARTLGSAVPAEIWTALWLYFTAPSLGMLLAAEIFLSRRGARSVRCAKLHHQNDRRCIFRCSYAAGEALAGSGN
jgi:aquaporin Z